jgi:hypothetical protein
MSHIDVGFGGARPRRDCIGPQTRCDQSEQYLRRHYVLLKEWNLFNKILLVAIAAGLWANVAATLVARPAHADAELSLHDIASDTSSIRQNLFEINMGQCRNSKLCCGQNGVVSAGHRD